MPLYIRCGISFASDFYVNHIGSDYSEEVFSDPIKRYKQEKKEQDFKVEKYPDFYPDGKKKTHPRLGIGVATIPKCWGCEIKFQETMTPTARPLLDQGADPLSLKEPNLEDSMQWLFEEIDVLLEQGWKKEHLNLPDLQGPLNLSMKLAGDNRMLSLIARKNKDKEVKHILEKSSNVYIDITKKLRKETGRSIKTNWSVSGCTYYYLRPPQWEKYIIPVIEKCREELGNGVRLHHCGKADANMMDSYKKIQWNSLEFGFGSDLTYARQNFINPKLGPLDISCRISPYRMLNQTTDQIRRDVESITSQIKGGPVSINVVGCPNNTPDENLWALWNAVQAYNKKKEEEEMQ